MKNTWSATPDLVKANLCSIRVNLQNSPSSLNSFDIRYPHEKTLNDSDCRCDVQVHDVKLVCMNLQGSIEVPFVVAFIVINASSQPNLYPSVYLVQSRYRNRNALTHKVQVSEWITVGSVSIYLDLLTAYPK
ncbi:unnamed protein product [Soboliphyme baturini]|uniref:Integrin_alpha2 domain-containing protein n=1 Tax=Soboliphyme baturini TaxID=241478 RepID=A0A183IYS3_9BILA|nr:unnamed protein product [Soboliphyme baturini]